MAENLPDRNIYVAYICTFLLDSKKTIMPIIILLYAGMRVWWAGYKILVIAYKEMDRIC